MAAAADSPDQERAGPRRPVLADVPRHNGAEAADRDRRHEGRTVQVRQAREIGDEVEVRSRLAVQLTSASAERLGYTCRHQAVPSWTREYIYV